MEHFEIHHLTVRPATPGQWDEVYGKCPYATYFHSREWANVWSEYFLHRTRPQPFEIAFPDGKTAILPLSASLSRHNEPVQWHSSMAGTYGGWISADLLTSAHTQSIVRLLQTRFIPGTWRCNPYLPDEQKVAVSGVKEDTTRSLDLTPGFEAILKGWTKGHLSAAKKADRLGVSVRLASTLEDWQAYFGLYEKSLERWGDKATSSYEWRLFESMCRLNSPHVRLWLASAEGQVIAGALCFYAADHIVYWHGSADAAHFEYRPVHLLIREIVREACRDGHSWFDFNPSGGHEGVEAFKKGFGAEALRSDVFLSKPAPKKPKPQWKRFFRSMVHHVQTTMFSPRQRVETNP